MAAIDTDAALRALQVASLVVTAECIDTADSGNLSLSGASDSRHVGVPPHVQVALALINIDQYDRDDPNSVSSAIGVAAGRGTAGAFAPRPYGTPHPPATVFLSYASIDPPVGELLAVAVVFTPHDDGEGTEPELVMTAVVPVSSLLSQAKGSPAKGAIPTSGSAAVVDDGVTYVVLSANVSGGMDLTTASNISTVQLQLNRPTLRSTGAVPSARVALRLKVEPLTAAFQAGYRGCRPGAEATSLAAYGCMKMEDLYRHNCYAAAVLRNHCSGLGATPVNLRDKKTVNAGVLATLRSSQQATPMSTLALGPGRVSYRWSLLKTLDLSGNIVGDASLPSVLSVVAHCAGLDTFVADRNSLSLKSALPIFHVLSQHPSIRRVSLKDNDFFEAAGDELLRVVKVNRRIIVFDVRGNAISDVLQKRFAAQVERNVKELAHDVFNPYSNHYMLPDQQAAGHGEGERRSGGVQLPTSPDHLPDATWDAVKLIWALLTASPKEEGGAASGVASSAVEPIVPPVVNAPLFSAVATRAYKTLVRAVTDPVLRQIMAPLCAVEEPGMEAQTVAADLARAALRTDLFVTRADGTTEYADQSLSVVDGASSQAEYAVAKAVLDADATAEYLYPNSFAKMHVVALGTMAAYPHRWGYAARALKCLGRAHEMLGVNESFYNAYNKAFYDALLHDLGPDTMHHTLRAAWLQASAFILRTVMAGRTAVLAVPSGDI